MTNPPHFKGFKPIGLPDEHTPIVINFDEYEAIRLSDFELHGHVVAAQIMEVSRPTFTRIYESARRKVAQAFVSGKPIVFEGGKVYFDSEWYVCNSCGCWFNHPAKEEEVSCCALCGSSDVKQYKDNSRRDPAEDICVCPGCGMEKIHIAGTSCKEEVCQDCDCTMVRNGYPK